MIKKTPDPVWNAYIENRQKHPVTKSITLVAKKFDLTYEEVCEQLGFESNPK